MAELKYGAMSLYLAKNAPKILFGVGVTGMIGTVVLSSSATLKASVVIDKYKERKDIVQEVRSMDSPEYSDDDYRKDLVYVYTGVAVDLMKLYWPAVALGAFSIACLTKSHHILTSRNAALTAAYAAIEKTFDTYRRNVRETFGEREELDVYRKTARDVAGIVKEDISEGKVVKASPSEYSGYARFFDEGNPNWCKTPEYNLIFLRCQQQFATDMLQSRGHIFLNEVYDMLGVPRSRAGSVVGWIIGKDNDNYVDFGMYDADKERARSFVNGDERSILLDFNVDGVIYDKI
jgi:hypothetical protein